ncbi:hypothetical protein [Xanthomonas rydalmerensis]|uniref:Secreted protein n=1 Tax=Xanthomonas rydalmerensis TaxID=3046274 RepID=A0ABZ0JPJ6_9XANT|nr:hypothetical protein [Xanthomonas sp. DM-2023]WOS41062.1 hypothetical protein QN243_00805 [Xanthomonas sp. DM-2023]WOS45247.1 hypothetical protein QN242_00805 [Xanthomonas sp. DM-2023]WOS49426.1 hypothetical protein QN240_00805 [Xanthomonas sp. DM-2023]WOS53606.1 hypothetical protein QN244_00805 [Xanthomonas sp. DM-2023]WOS57789.1 hypothetical protein QN245_00805 [Xanthomonas sp. DM-2023]
MDSIDAADPIGRRLRTVLAVALLAACMQAQAQQTPPDAQASAPPPPSVAAPPAPDAAAQPDIQTLGEVRALPPDEGEPLDLYRFKNPVSPPPNRFDKDWRPPPSVEQVSQSGGYIALGVYYLAGKAAKGLHALTGGPDQVQAAVARPPPQLSEAELQRAMKVCAEQGGGCAVGQ